MTSTFTALIQRYRGNRGKREVFRYLWNELPDSGAKFERGRHAISECIPLDCGRMVDLFQGPYSWNRVSQQLNPAWMREWPESFLLPEVLQTGSLVKEKETVTVPTSLEISGFIKEPVLYVGFENLQVAIRCEDGALFKRLATELGVDIATRARNVIANFDITQGASYGITQRGHAKGTLCDKKELPIELKRQIATLLAGVRHNYSWLTSAAFAKDGRGLVIAGDVDDANDQFVCLLEARGWRSIDRKLIAIRAGDLMVIPFGAQTQGEGSASQVRFAVPLDRLVIAKKAPLYARDTRILPMSPAHGVAALVGLSLDFSVERERAVEKLCRLIEQRPAALLHYSRPDEAAEVISRFARCGRGGHRVMAPRDIKLTIRLINGDCHEVRLGEDAPELATLFGALASPSPEHSAENQFVELPLEGGRVAWSFRTSNVVSILSDPPVVLNPEQLKRPAQTEARADGSAKDAAGVVNQTAYTRRPRFVVVDDFLAAEEHDELLAYALVSEDQFQPGTVSSYEPGVRQNQAIMNFGESVQHPIP